MMREGETPFVFSGQQLLPSLSASFSPLGSPQHPRSVAAFAHTPCSLQTLVDARGCGKTADAGQRRALEHPAGHRPLTPRLPTTSSFPRAPVDAPRRPLHASRLPTCSGTLLSPLQLAPERRPARPMLAPLLWPACSSPRSSSLSLAPYTTPTNTPEPSVPFLMATQADPAGTRRPRLRWTSASLYKATSSHSLTPCHSPTLQIDLLYHPFISRAARARDQARAPPPRLVSVHAVHASSASVSSRSGTARPR